MYSAAAGTAYVTFDNVKVPVENTIGPKDSGILIIFSYVLVHILFLKLDHTHLDW